MGFYARLTAMEENSPVADQVFVGDVVLAVNDRHGYDQLE